MLPGAVFASEPLVPRYLGTTTAYAVAFALVGFCVVPLTAHLREHRRVRDGVFAFAVLGCAVAMAWTMFYFRSTSLLFLNITLGSSYGLFLTSKLRPVEIVLGAVALLGFIIAANVDGLVRVLAFFVTVAAAICLKRGRPEASGAPTAPPPRPKTPAP